MSIQLSPEIESDARLLPRVKNSEQMIEGLLPPTARAFWDLKHDEGGRPLLTLALSDPFGYAAADFAPEDLDSPNETHRRVYDLVGELIQSVRRVRIEARDRFISADEIADFQQRLNAIPNIAIKRPKIYNRVQSSPTSSGRFLMTDIAVDVDGDVAELVKQALRDSGFNLREDPLLQRHGMRERVRELVEQHRRDQGPLPRYAICFNMQDLVDLHLLEICDDVRNLGEGTLEGLGLAAGDSLPGARSIVLYSASPADLRLAARRDPNHPAVRGLRERNCWFVMPDDNGDSFYREFPEFARG